MTTHALTREDRNPWGKGVLRAALRLVLLAALCFSPGVVGRIHGQPGTAQSAAVSLDHLRPASAAKPPMLGPYEVHQDFEAGWRITNTQGSQGMWDTLVDMGSGGRILNQSLLMHTTDPHKSPWFDNLSTFSYGYGGDPNNVSRLDVSKGRIYNFTGTFRRDRLYFDDNLLANSLNTNPAGLVPEIDSPHLYNTVRRNTDTLLTLLPLSPVSLRAGFRYNISEGPSYSSVQEGADALLYQQWHNAFETWIAGIDWKPAPRTTVSFDQLWLHFKGDTRWQLAGLNEMLPNGQPVSYGLDPGSGKCPGVVNGVGLPTCNGYLAMSIFEPVRTNFPTEQFRFSSRYWQRVAMNGRLVYSDARSVVPSYNELFNGLTTRTGTRQELDVGAGPGGQLANNKRINVNADFALDAELNKTVSLADVFNFWDFRIPGSNNYNTTVWAGPAGTNLLTPVSSLTPVTTPNTNLTFLNQAIQQNTVTAIVAVLRQLKISGGYRFRNRHIMDYGPDDLAWHENWELAGAVAQPTPRVRINADYEHMNSASANDATTSNTFTRLMPDVLDRIVVRGTVKTATWLTLAAAGSDLEARNDDPFVNHHDHSRDISLAATITPSDHLSFDLNVAHDAVYSVTDICYIANPAPTGAVNAGTCTAANSGGNGGPSYLLGNDYYHAPSTFFSGMVTWSPVRRFRFNGGTRVNYLDGTYEMLNPNMVPGALQSTYLTPFADAQFDVDKGWIWHANWTRDDYAEHNPPGITAPRNVHGDIVTLSVRYNF